MSGYQVRDEDLPIVITALRVSGRRWTDLAETLCGPKNRENYKKMAADAVRIADEMEGK